MLYFDFDGGLADTAKAFLRLACDEYGDCGFRLEDITSFEVEASPEFPVRSDFL